MKNTLRVYIVLVPEDEFENNFLIDDNDEYEPGIVTINE